METEDKKNKKSKRESKPKKAKVILNILSSKIKLH